MVARVLIVDDSALVRQVLTQVLDNKAGLSVMAAAQDPIFAMRLMEKEWPDVIVLDIEMPRMDGLTFLRKIMVERPTPVVICSTLTERGTETAMQAMAAGAVDVISKPRVALKQFLTDTRLPVIDAVRAACQARLGPFGVDVAGSRRAAPRRPPASTAGRACPPIGETTDFVVALGTSTGGTRALERILPSLRADAPGMVVVQHMPEKFTAAFAQRLNELSEVEVVEAGDADRVIPGRVLIAPGGRHMMLKRSGAQYRVEVRDGPVVSRHKPSVDVLFRSVAQHAAANAVGFILTGMGDDGAAGMLEMHRRGALTIAEHPSTCIVHGMPREAVRRGAVDAELPLQDIAALIQSLRDRQGLEQARRSLGAASQG